MQTKKHYIDIIFIIVLIGIFAISSIMLAVLGVNIYKGTTDSDSKQELNTAALYFAQKIRQCEDKSDVRIDSMGDDIPVLVISSDTEGKSLETWLFVYEGELKELTVIKGGELSREFGQQIMPLKNVDFHMTGDDLLEISLTSHNGYDSSIDLHVPDFNGGVR